MEKNNRGGRSSRPISDKGIYNLFNEDGGKVKHYYTPLQKIRNLFLNGGVYTARRLNELSQSNDARKCISVLRHAEYMPIKDKRRSDGCKLYWLDRSIKAKEGELW